MITWLSTRVRSLPARIVFGTIAVIVATLLAVGIPTLFFLRGELERQAEARLAQGADSTQAIYAARLRELQALVTLTSERPTLVNLIQQNNQVDLPAYLETIRDAAPLDVIVLFDSSNHLLAHAQLPSGWNNDSAGTLSTGSDSGIIRIDLTSGPVLALKTVAPVHDSHGATIGLIAAGTVLDRNFANVLHDQTGLFHNFYSRGSRVTSTLSGLPPQFDQVSPGFVSLDGNPVFMQALSLQSGPDPVVDILALPGEEIVSAEKQVILFLAAGSFVIALLAGLIGYVLAKRITAPLHGLVAASESIGRGDLTTPVHSTDTVTEVVALARALERMRRRLAGAYDDLERAKAWSENLVGSMVEGVLTVDGAGRITSFSSGAERILGWRATDVIGRSFESVFQSPLADHPAPGTVARLPVTTRDGQPVVLLITGGGITPRDDGSWEQALVFRDVTQEEESLRLREFFLANVSHELKTPLSSLRASIELLAADLPVLTIEERDELINSLWLGTIRLEELVDNLLSSASIQSGHFQVHARPMELEPLLEELLSTTRPLLALRGQHLELDVPPSLPPVLADRRRLIQVLNNLISNASKYGGSERPITVRAFARLGYVVVQVVDCGPGISSEEQAALFEPFKRGDGSASSGVGLGLSIVKTIVERHGGEVGVKRVADGNAFWFSLRAATQTVEVPATSKV